MTTEEQYYYNKSSQDRIYGDLQHEATMAVIVADQEFSIMRNVGARIFKDGNAWCCLYGENLQVGIAGFGDTPYKAVLDFNKAFHKN